MSRYLGDYPVGLKVRIPFNTNAASGASATFTGTVAGGNIDLYKNTGTTIRSSNNGITLFKDHNSKTGTHILEIDLADDTDAGFYASGSFIDVVLDTITVDGKTVSASIGFFTIGLNPAVLASGRIGATGNSTTALHLTGQPFGDDELNGNLIIITDVSANERHARWIEDWADTGDLATVTTLPFTPENSVDLYQVLSLNRRIDVESWNNVKLATTNPLPTAAADAAGGLPVSDAGGLDLDTLLGRLDETVSAAKVLTAAYDAAKTAAQAGDQMDLVDAPNATAVTAIQNGLATSIETGVIDTVVDAIKLKTDNLPASPAATGDIPTVAQIWTTALTEAYKTVGSTGTGAQLLYEILQNLTDFSISDTTKTVRKLDGTTAKTYTYNNATAPTSVEETS